MAQLTPAVGAGRSSGSSGWRIMLRLLRADFAKNGIWLYSVPAEFPDRDGDAMLSSVGVYCSSSRGADPGYAAAAASLGQLLAGRGIRLVYGGAHVGLMGVLADAALAGGGQVHGVITRALQAKEIAHQGLTSLEVVTTMHQRKAAMADQADAFIMLPGGFGTLDEFFEAVTWTQLGIHAKPCGVLDAGGYFAPLRALLASAAGQGFLLPEHRDMVIMESDPGMMLDRLSAWKPVFVEKWLDRHDR